MEEVHIEMVWDELESRFGFPKKEWKKAFKEHLSNQHKSEDAIGIFLKFGNQRINPIINGILMRNEHHPTFNKLVEYVIRKSLRKSDL